MIWLLDWKVPSLRHLFHALIWRSLDGEASIVIVQLHVPIIEMRVKRMTHSPRVIPLCTPSPSIVRSIIHSFVPPQVMEKDVPDTTPPSFNPNCSPSKDEDQVPPPKSNEEMLALFQSLQDRHPDRVGTEYSLLDPVALDTDEEGEEFDRTQMVLTYERNWSSIFRTIELAGDAARKTAFDALPDGGEILNDEGRPIGVKRTVGWISERVEGRTARFDLSVNIINGKEKGTCSVCGDEMHEGIDDYAYDIHEIEPNVDQWVARHSSCPPSPPLLTPLLRADLARFLRDPSISKRVIARTTMLLGKLSPAALTDACLSQSDNGVTICWSERALYFEIETDEFTLMDLGHIMTGRMPKGPLEVYTDIQTAANRLNDEFTKHV